MQKRKRQIEFAVYRLLYRKMNCKPPTVNCELPATSSVLPILFLLLPIPVPSFAKAQINNPKVDLNTESPPILPVLIH
jgi:hypothetical protein